VLEITLSGPKILFKQALTVALAGAVFDMLINDLPVNCQQPLTVNSGDILTIGQARQGARGYLAISGQLQITPCFNSFATHVTASYGGYRGRALEAGDSLDVLPAQGSNSLPLQPVSIAGSQGQHYSGSYLIRCLPGGEQGCFSKRQTALFSGQKYCVSNDSNRVGIRLLGEPLPFETPVEISSSGIVPGTVQVPPSGLPIITGVDGPTVGGYPRIANVISADLPLLGQLKHKDKITFHFIGLQQARNLYQSQYL
jgi:biotin-dependent carboxylase-like uncharacterized protein